MLYIFLNFDPKTPKQISYIHFRFPGNWTKTGRHRKQNFVRKPVYFYYDMGLGKEWFFLTFGQVIFDADSLWFHLVSFRLFMKKWKISILLIFAPTSLPSLYTKLGCIPTNFKIFIFQPKFKAKMIIF